MWRVFVLAVSLIANVDSIIPRRSRPYSAASPAQIRFAIENKYDDTGPGAKTPQYAYHTYKTLDEALVNYLDDPDTKLPEYERQRATAILKGTDPNEYSAPIRQLPKTVEEYTGYNEANKEQVIANQFNLPSQQVFYRDPSTNYGYLDLAQTELKDVPPKKYLNGNTNGVLGYQRGQPIKGSRINLANYMNDPDVREAHDQFDPNPRYSFSYGVHDTETGDSKSAHEMRDGSTVRGFYTFMDADGKQRTVHYTADDKIGFRATVQRTHST